jgi:hypothetical protein
MHPAAQVNQAAAAAAASHLIWCNSVAAGSKIPPPVFQLNASAAGRYLSTVRDFYCCMLASCRHALQNTPQS